MKWEEVFDKELKGRHVEIHQLDSVQRGLIKKASLGGKSLRLKLAWRSILQESGEWEKSNPREEIFIDLETSVPRRHSDKGIIISMPLTGFLLLFPEGTKPGPDPIPVTHT